MKIDIKYCLIAILIFGVCMFFPAGRCSKHCAPCPEIKQIAVQTKDTVINHPVAISSSDSNNVKIVYKQHISYRTITIHDTVKKADPVIDSSACWYGTEHLSSGDLINWSMCSALLPVSAPVDLQRKFELIRHPDTVQIKTVVHSIIMPPKKWYVGVGIYAGGGVDAFGRPCAQAGVGVQFGRALKQF